MGKYIGVLAFVLAQASYFVVGTWLALALRTGIWDANYLLSVPLLLLHFAIFFSFSLLLAVCTRSTVVSVFGSIAFWGICWAINFGRHSVMAAAARRSGGLDLSGDWSGWRILATGFFRSRSTWPALSSIPWERRAVSARCSSISPRCPWGCRY